MITYNVPHKPDFLRDPHCCAPATRHSESSPARNSDGSPCRPRVWLQSVSIRMFEQGCAVGLKAETAIFAETCGLVNVKKWLLHVWRKNQGTATSFNLQEGNFARFAIGDRAAAPHFLLTYRRQVVRRYKRVLCHVPSFDRYEDTWSRLRGSIIIRGWAAMK